MRASTFLVLATLMGCAVAPPTDSGETGHSAGGKADDASECQLWGSFAAEGDFQSFSRWDFTFERDQLTDSHTDDLPADEWTTTVIRDDNASRLSLIQITHASDAIIETALHMNIEGCDRDGVTLSPVAAYTTTFDEASGGLHDVDAHSVTLTNVGAGPSEGPQGEVNARVAAILAEYDLNQLPFTVDAEELAAQEALDNTVDFDNALRRAISSFLHDGDDLESPVALVSEDLGNTSWGESCLDTDDSTDAVRCFMNRPDSGLRLLTREQRPEGYEDPMEKWIFSVYLESLSDHGHWAVVDRQNARERVYNYGFN